jgi:hypothetical protein
MGGILVKTTIAILVTFLLLTAANAESTKDATATPIAGINDAAMASSARASKIIGSKVYKGDTSIGSIEDVLVDLSHGATAAVILSIGGFLGVDEKLVAVPTTAIRVDSEARFTTDLTKEQLSNAAAFDFAKLK